MKIKLIRITTVPVSLQILLHGQHKFIHQYFDIVGVSSSGSTLYKVGESEKIRVHAIKMSRTISVLKDLKSLLELCIFIRSEKPQIVHTHTPKAGTLGMIAAWICRVPVRMHTVAGLPLLETSGAKRKLLDIVEKITYACAIKVYPNSFGLEKLIIKNKYCKPNKLHVIGNGSSNGIDTSYFSRLSLSQKKLKQISDEFKIINEDFVFIFIGRLVKDKGINKLISAFKTLNENYPKTKLILVGNFETDLDPLLPETLVSIKKHSSILYAGYQPDVRPYLAISKALVFPSYREGFPNVPMQALAMELPSIVTDINGCNEIIIHEYNGLIIPPKNTQAIFVAMEQMLKDKELYNHLKSNARESIVSRYDQQTLWKLIKQEYDDQLMTAGLSN